MQSAIYLKCCKVFYGVGYRFLYKTRGDGDTFKLILLISIPDRIFFSFWFFSIPDHIFFSF